jgi:hypothetical protein
MKFSINFICVCVSMFFAGCIRFGSPVIYTTYKPMFISRSSLNNSIKLENPKSINDAGKIYQKGDYIFIGERFNGIHIINNKDPKNPINEAFISIPGCVDIAIKNNTLYVDNAVDLVALDLLSIRNKTIKILKRVEDVFPEVGPPDGGELQQRHQTVNRTNGNIIVGWTK